MDYGIFAGLMALCRQIDHIPPTAVCAADDPGILLLLTINNICIGIWYFCIPFLMRYIRKKRDDIKGRALVGWSLFQIFVVFCGAGHVAELAAIWLVDGIFITAYWHCMTNLVSAATVVFLLKYKKYLLNIPTAHTLDNVLLENTELKQQQKEYILIVERQKTLIKAQELRLNLKQN